MHLFLTGAKGVGKSTLLRQLLSSWEGTPGGFRTVRREGCVYLLSRATGLEPCGENRLFTCGEDDLEAIGAGFDVLGLAALSEQADLYVMDELGPHEERALAFQERVLTLLSGDVPVVGVLQQAESDFLRCVAAHPNVHPVEVTAENREALAQQLKLPTILKPSKKFQNR